jgi:hypothetical protein
MNKFTFERRGLTRGQRWHFGQWKLARWPTIAFLIGVEHV